MPTPTLTQAIAIIRAGGRAEGRAMLEQILAADPRNVMALLWMTEVADTDKERREYLNQVLAIDPNNPTALKGLELLGPADEQLPLMTQAKPIDAQPKTPKATIERITLLPTTSVPEVILIIVGILLILIIVAAIINPSGVASSVPQSTATAYAPIPTKLAGPEQVDECDAFLAWAEDTLPNLAQAIALAQELDDVINQHTIDLDRLYHISTEYYALSANQLKVTILNNKMEDLNWTLRVYSEPFWRCNIRSGSSHRIWQHRLRQRRKRKSRKRKGRLGFI